MFWFCLFYSQSVTGRYVKHPGRGGLSKAVSSAGSTLSAGMCASACLRSEPSCIGFYYNKVSETCELLDKMNLTDGAERLSQTWILGNTHIY